LKPKNIPVIITREKINGSQTCNFFLLIVYRYFVCKIAVLK
jgi:hypothetical protein